jgi:hypothetical protein
MTERTRRATEAVDAHTEYWESCSNGSDKAQIENGLLDVCRSPGDPRYGHEKFFYGEYGGTFQSWMKHISGRAQTYTATTELWREVILTTEMLREEGIDWLPMKESHVPASSGFFIAPYGIEIPKDECWLDFGVKIDYQQRMPDGFTKSVVLDQGGGDRWFLDGFMWEVNNKVAADGVAGPPSRGVTILPLTRWRGRDDDRPFRLSRMAQPNTRPPHFVASDLTAWKFDALGETEWQDMKFAQDNIVLQVRELSGDDPDQILTQQHLAQQSIYSMRIWLRSLVWSTFRWMTEEISFNERPERAAQRRAKKRPIFDSPNAEDGDLVIFDLRKEVRDAIEKHETSGEPRWWRSRWIVRKHKARRRYSIRDENGVPVGPRTGPDAVLGVTYEYRLVEIEPYEKGPDSAPLIFKENVGVLSR